MSKASNSFESAVFESILSTALSARSRLETDGAGGTDGLWRLFRCVGRVQVGATWLGSCTLLPGGRFALTAAHVVSAYRGARGYRVVFPAAQGKTGKTVESVAKIHWQTGEMFDFRTAKAPWPASVEHYRGDRDCLALLELMDCFDEDAIDAYPRLSGMSAPQEEDWLITAGFGEDANGNRLSNVWTATSRHVGRDAVGFGLHAPRRTDLFCGMPRGGDSGGPVFWPPMSNPFHGRYLRLAGVHSERVPDPSTGRERARYLRIDHLASAWIRSCLQQSGSSSDESNPAPERPGQPRRAGNVEFCHRKDGERPYYTFNDPPNEIDGVRFFVRDVKGDILVDGSKGYARVVGDKVELTLDVKDPNQGQVTRTWMLRRSDICGGGHWYQNDPDLSGNDGFPLHVYLFKLTNKEKPPKGGPGRGDVVFIEVFVKNSGHVHPSAKTLFEAGCKEEACTGTSAAHDDPWEPDQDTISAPTPDQDDEGNGEEDPT